MPKTSHEAGRARKTAHRDVLRKTRLTTVSATPVWTSGGSCQIDGPSESWSGRNDGSRRPRRTFAEVLVDASVVATRNLSERAYRFNRLAHAADTWTARGRFFRQKATALSRLVVVDAADFEQVLPREASVLTVLLRRRSGSNVCGSLGAARMRSCHSALARAPAVVFMQLLFRQVKLK